MGMTTPLPRTALATQGPLHRRELLRWGTVTGLAATTFPLLAEKAIRKQRPKVCVYTEHFQSLPIPQVCKLFQTMGVDGLDLTVRPGGHIEPRDVKAKLPKAAQVASDHGLQIMNLTTSITAANRAAEETLAACQQLGISRIKLGYYRAGKFGELSSRLAEAKRHLEQLVTLAAKYDVLPCVHVHSGSTLPSNGLMLFNLIRDLPKTRIGAFLDSYHMTITGGAGGWRQAIDLLRPWTAMVALKNFQWHRGDRDDMGQQRWRTDYCPLADGVAPIGDFVRTIQQSGYQGFYTLHTEYRQPTEKCLQLTADDFKFLKKVFAQL